MERERSMDDLFPDQFDVAQDSLDNDWGNSGKLGFLIVIKVEWTLAVLKFVTADLVVGMYV